MKQQALKGLKLKAYRTRYDFHKMRVRNGIIRGHYNLGMGYQSTTKLAYIDDVIVTEMKNGNRIVSHRGNHIHTFGPIK